MQDSRPGRLAFVRDFDSVAIALGCLAFAAVLAVPAILSDSDTFWQIRTGEWILAHHAVPVTDPFSFTAGDRRWFPHEWLSEVLLALSFRAGGLAGVMALAAAACGVTVAVMARHLRRWLSGFRAFEGLVLGVSMATPSLLARPHLLAWPCLAMWTAGLAMARARRTAPSWWLLPVMLVWVNLHGSFMAGLLLPVALAVEAMAEQGADRRGVLVAWGQFIVAAWIVALANPAFADGVMFPLRMVRMTSLGWVGEWAPPDFSRFQPLEVVIVAGLLLGFLRPVRVPVVRLLIVIGLLHEALAHARNEQLLGIVGALLLAEPIGTGLGEGAARAVRIPVAWGAGVLAAVALAVRLAVPLSPVWTGAGFASVLAAVPVALRAQPVLNEYGYGGWLIFDGVRPFIDSRADLYGDGFVTRYRQAMGGGPAFERLLAEYRIAWTVFSAGNPIVGVLDRMPGWRRLVAKDGVVVHERVGGDGAVAGPGPGEDVGGRPPPTLTK